MVPWSDSKGVIDSGLVGSTDWEGYHESRRCSRDTYPESYITKYTSIRCLYGYFMDRTPFGIRDSGFGIRDSGFGLGSDIRDSVSVAPHGTRGVSGSEEGS